eukprot:scaffold320570_cov28-Tisochrysis_lutea.AAC.2
MGRALKYPVSTVSLRIDGPTRDFLFTLCLTYYIHFMFESYAIVHRQHRSRYIVFAQVDLTFLSARRTQLQPATSASID